MDPSPIVTTTFTRLKFPGDAGRLQEKDATGDALVTELGENYERYHVFLRDRLTTVGGRPDPADFESIDAYAAAWTVVEEIVKAEDLLRRAQAARQSGRSLAAGPVKSQALLDSKDKLLPQSN